jgi:hypothetical protein
MASGQSSPQTSKSSCKFTDVECCTVGLHGELVACHAATNMPTPGLGVAGPCNPLVYLPLFPESPVIRQPGRRTAASEHTQDRQPVVDQGSPGAERPKYKAKGAIRDADHGVDRPTNVQCFEHLSHPRAGDRDCAIDPVKGSEAYCQARGTPALHRLNANLPSIQWPTAGSGSGQLPRK